MVSPVTEDTRFTFSHVSDLLKEPKPLRWLVEDYLQPEILALLFGEPGSGKSLLALLWAVELALNDQPVFIIAGEGHFGLRRRLKALAIELDCENELTTAPLIISDNGTALLDEKRLAETRDSIDKQLEKHGKPALIIIDTLNRNFGPGDENSANDVSKLIQALDSLRERYEATILVVHHSGHSKQARARGSSALLGAVDTELCLTKTEEDNIRVLEVTKMKDAPTPEPKAFRIKQIELPLIDSNGRPETSVVLEASDRPVLKESRPKKRQTLPMKEGLASLKKALEQDGIEPPWAFSEETSKPLKVVQLEDWRKHYYAINPDRSKETAKKYFGRAREELVNSGAIAEKDSYFWLECGIDKVLKTKADAIKKPIKQKQPNR